MLHSLAPILLLLHSALAAPVENAAAATVGKIRGVRDPIYHLYLQASSKNGPSHIRHILTISPLLNPLSNHARPRPRKRSRRIHNRRHHPIEKDEQIPQHRNSIDELQALGLGSNWRDDGMGIRG